MPNLTHDVKVALDVVPGGEHRKQNLPRLEEVAKLCDKVMLISNGQVRAFDRISDLTRQGINLADYYRHNLSAPIA